MTPSPGAAILSTSRPYARGRLSLEFAADGDGRSYLRRQFASYPFHVCRVKYLDAADPAFATLYVQSCSGGIYEDDELSLELIARRNTNSHVTTQASTIVHTMSRGMASLRMQITAEENSYTEFLPDPQILFAGSMLASTIRVTAAKSATVVLCDSLLSHDPSGLNGSPQHYCSSLLVEDEAGKQLAADRLTLTENAFSDRRPGVLGQYNAQGTLLVISRDANARRIQAGVRELDIMERNFVIGVTQLPNEAGYLCRLLARDGVALKRTMGALWQMVRLGLRGHEPAARPK